MTEEQWLEYLQRSKAWSIRVGHDLLHSHAYRDLNYGPALKVLNWFHEKVRFNVDKKKRGKDRYQLINGGEISFTYDEAMLRGLEHRKFARALKELVHFGFINLKKHGSGMRKDYSIFTLSERWRDYGTPKFIAQEIPSVTERGYRKERRGKVDCAHCVQKANVGNDGRLRCSHPDVVEIGNLYPDRSPGLALATALSLMKKALEVKINSDALRNPWFKWPFCFDGRFIEACSGYEKAQRPETDVEQRRKTDVVRATRKPKTDVIGHGFDHSTTSKN